MIKILAIGGWICFAALGSSFATASLWTSGPEAPKVPSYFEGLDYQKTDGIVVPILWKEAVAGYILANFVYTIDGELSASMAVPPAPFVTDEAFRAIYAKTNFDPEKPEAFDLAGLAKSIREAVNKRYGSDVVHDILVQQFDFIPKGQGQATAKLKSGL